MIKWHVKINVKLTRNIILRILQKSVIITWIISPTSLACWGYMGYKRMRLKTRLYGSTRPS